MTKKEYDHLYYINNLQKKTENNRKYQAKIKGSDYKPKEYKGRTAFILCNEKETLYFKNAREISRYFGINYNTLMSRIYKNKKKKTIAGYEIDFAI